MAELGDDPSKSAEGGAKDAPSSLSGEGKAASGDTGPAETPGVKIAKKGHQTVIQVSSVITGLPPGVMQMPGMPGMAPAYPGMPWMPPGAQSMPPSYPGMNMYGAWGAYGQPSVYPSMPYYSPTSGQPQQAWPADPSSAAGAAGPEQGYTYPQPPMPGADGLQGHPNAQYGYYQWPYPTAGATAAPTQQGEYTQQPQQPNDTEMG